MGTAKRIFFYIFFVNVAIAQIDGNEKRYIKIGELHNHYFAIGSERAWNHNYYEGLQWPADYNYTDNAIIRRTWFAIKNFTDVNGENWDYWANYLIKNYDQKSIFPIQFEQIAKFDLPTIIIDGEDITDRTTTKIDRINPNMKADRVIINKINTSCGITMTRKIYAFSQQYHDNYFITKYIFKNTGNVDADDEIELHSSIEGFRFGYTSRYSVCREGAMFVDSQQAWGKHSWVSKRGEDYINHLEDIKNFTETTEQEKLDWLPVTFSWLGQSEKCSFDMVGAPNIDGNGRLGSPQFAGIGVLHVDHSPSDQTNDPNKIVTIGWHAGDSYPHLGNMEKSDMAMMKEVYEMLSGEPYPDDSHGDTNRMFEDNTTSITDQTDPYRIHGKEGGSGIWITYGPYDLEIGDSVVVVEVEGISGINRKLCEEVGNRWLTAYENPNDNDSFKLPDSTTTGNKNIYKNSWVYTGVDSIMATFSRATRNFNRNMNIPQPPLPPTKFEISSDTENITLQWTKSPSENDNNFKGYKIYRAIEKPDTFYNLIAEIDPKIYFFQDTTVTSGKNYFYYITTYSDGSNNKSGLANPTGSLESSRFYTKSDSSISLKNNPSDIKNIGSNPGKYSLQQNCPNPFNPVTSIQYKLPIDCKVVLSVYDLNGRLVDTMVNEMQSAGSYSVQWNAGSYSSGVYFYKIHAGNFNQVRKCILLK